MQDGPVRTHAVAALDRCHEVPERGTKLREFHTSLILGERGCGLQGLAELVRALSELNRRLGVEHGAALLRGELIKQEA